MREWFCQWLVRRRFRRYWRAHQAHLRARYGTTTADLRARVRGPGKRS